VGREHAMEANEMESGPGDQGGQALQEFQRGHHDMRGPIAVGRFELQDDLAGRGAAQPFVAQCSGSLKMDTRLSPLGPPSGALRRSGALVFCCGVGLKKILSYWPCIERSPFGPYLGIPPIGPSCLAIPAQLAPQRQRG